MTSPVSIKDLLDRLNLIDESHEIEAKCSELELGKSVLDTVSAFCNEPGLGGGTLVFGVVEDEVQRRFVPKGVKAPKKLEQEIATLCASAFNSVVRPRVWTEVVAGVSLVGVFIPEASAAEKPVFDKKRGMQHGTFRRIGSTDQRCTEDDLRVLFQSSSVAPYEDTIVSDASMEDLDQEVIASYKRQLVDANPATELRDASVEELVQSLGGARRVDGRLVPTVAGVLLFAKKLSLRRLFPGVRVDYIRVPGTEWVPDPEHRFESIEVREPLLVTFRRIYNAIVDDLPKAFALEPGSPERKDVLALPESVVREVLVNALTHRDYRIANPTQVIRYQDRIEVRNSGYSLADADQFGEPGSFPRNTRIADMFREMRLAENRGTGITAVRRAMDRAGLTPPVFDSDRPHNRFVATLWMHNLISAEESAWLNEFAGGKVSDAQARALVVAKRTGSVTNAILRDVSGLDTLSASFQLRQLCEWGLLERRGKSVATHYLIGPTVDAQTGGFDAQTGGFDAQTGGFDAQTGGFLEENRGAHEEILDVAALLKDVPSTLHTAVTSLSGKPTAANLRKVIVQLCELRWWTPQALAAVLKRKDPSHLSEKHLSQLVKEGKLERRYPTNPAHPHQAYRARQSSLLEGEDGGRED